MKYTKTEETKKNYHTMHVHLYSNRFQVPWGLMFLSFHQVMKTLVRFGAPMDILIDGKPHLGTDRLIPLLRNFRNHLEELGVSDIICTSLLIPPMVSINIVTKLTILSL